ncbi:hypothetical protein EHM76_04870 [bacterium]|nr:MAG: hypothetical protein EHM76_04870 [bacterium]
MTPRRCILSGLLLLLTTLVMTFITGWSDDPNEALAQAIFIGTSAAIGLGLFAFGIGGLG